MTVAETRMSALDQVLDAEPGAAGMAADLFAAVDALDSSVTLRRALTDPGTDEAGRTALAHGVLDGRMSTEAVNLVAQAAGMRWAGGRTFADAIERQAVRAELMKADRAGDLGDTEDALFRFARLVEASPDLRNVLGDRRASIAQRQRLVDDLLGGKVNGSTLVLARRSVRARERTFDHTIGSYTTLAAAQRSRVLATVRVAKPLTSEQLERLRTVLSRQVGREVGVQMVVDPEVLGGARVQLGDEVVEGTVGSRLADAKRLFS